MEKIKLTANILFSDIGCQERGFHNSELCDMDISTTSDIDKDAIVSYASIHNGLTKELVENYYYPSKEEMIADMERMNIGFDPNKKNDDGTVGKVFDWKKLAKKKDKMKGIEIYWLACKLSNQLGDISKIENLPYADLWTISFCCQDISVAGKMKGLTPDSGTRSSLLWENIKLLKDSVERNEAPKYLMFENVKNLVGHDNGNSTELRGDERGRGLDHLHGCDEEARQGRALQPGARDRQHDDRALRAAGGQVQPREGRPVAPVDVESR